MWVEASELERLRRRAAEAHGEGYFEGRAEALRGVIAFTPEALERHDAQVFESGRARAYAECEPTFEQRAELQAEVDRLRVRLQRAEVFAREASERSAGFHAECIATERKLDRLLEDLAASRGDGFVPVAELETVFAEGVGMGAEAVVLDVSQYLGALAEVERRHGCGGCAEVIGDVAAEVPSIVLAMRAARPGLCRRQAR